MACRLKRQNNHNKEFKDAGSFTLSKQGNKLKKKIQDSVTRDPVRRTMRDALGQGLCIRSIGYTVRVLCMVIDTESLGRMLLGLGNM